MAWLWKNQGIFAVWGASFVMKLFPNFDHIYPVPTNFRYGSLCQVFYHHIYRKIGSRERGNLSRWFHLRIAPLFWINPDLWLTENIPSNLLRFLAPVEFLSFYGFCYRQVALIASCRSNYGGHQCSGLYQALLSLQNFYFATFSTACNESRHAEPL